MIDHGIFSSWYKQGFICLCIVFIDYDNWLCCGLKSDQEKGKVKKRKQKTVDLTIIESSNKCGFFPKLNILFAQKHYVRIRIRISVRKFSYTEHRSYSLSLESASCFLNMAACAHSKFTIFFPYGVPRRVVPYRAK